MKKKQQQANPQNEEKKRRKWTEEEDRLLLNQVRAFPQNLTKCFLIVSEMTNRTPSSVSAHWYTSLSKRDDVLCFFTASPKHVSRNRKNGAGEETSESIWKKFLKIINSIFK